MTTSDDELTMLRTRVEDLQQALEALRDGAVDALVGRTGDPQLYALVSADRPYRVIVERMGQGAATATAEGVLLFANLQLAALLDVERDALVGRDLTAYVAPQDRPELERLLAVDRDGTRRGEVSLVTATPGSEVPVLVAATALEIEGVPVRCLVVTDLTAQKELERRQAAEALLEEQREARADLAREVNDTIVQGLVAAEMALDLGHLELARATVASTSARARGWIGELVEGGRLEPGMAVRSTPARSTPARSGTEA